MIATGAMVPRSAVAITLLPLAARAQVPVDQLAKPPADARQFTILSTAGTHGHAALWISADGTSMSRESLLLRRRETVPELLALLGVIDRQQQACQHLVLGREQRLLVLGRRQQRQPAAELEAGLGVLAAFVKAGLVASNGEARRQIKNGGLRVNDDTVTDEKMTLTPAQLTPQGVVKLSLGKKRHVLLKPV